MIAHLGLGSNLGDRAKTIAEALRLIGELPDTDVIQASKLYTTPPAYVLDQPEFLNAAAIVETAIQPHAFLDELLAIEQALGRVRVLQNGPRSIDLDILLWGSSTIDSDALTVPHPAMHLRDFVLVPLAEIAPDARHPSRDATVRQLLEEVDVNDVVPFDPTRRSSRES